MAKNEPKRRGIIGRTIGLVAGGVKLVIVLVLCLFLFVAYQAIRTPVVLKDDGPSRIVAAAPSKAEDKPAEPAIRMIEKIPDEPVTLERPGGAGHVHFCIDREAFDRLQVALKAKKMGDFSRLREDGRILMIPNGTKGVAYEVLGEGKRVRLDGGEHSGETGWVASEYLH